MLKQPLMFPQLALPSPKLTEYEGWAIVLYSKLLLSVGMVQRFVGELEEFTGINILSPALKKAGRCGLLWHNYSPIISLW